LRQAHGRDWDRLAAAVPGKTRTQIKNYYQNYKNKLGLETLRPECAPGGALYARRARANSGGGDDGGTPGSGRGAGAESLFDTAVTLELCPSIAPAVDPALLAM